MSYDAEKLSRIADELCCSSLWDIFKENPLPKLADGLSLDQNQKQKER